MKKGSLVVRPHFIVYRLLIVLAIVGVHAAWSPAFQSASASEADELRVLATLPAFTLTDQAGRAVGRDELAGKAWVANFIFTRCRATCPVQTRMMSQLQERLAAHPRWRDVRLISFSVDPEHDTPAVLREYARQAGADAGHWRFLTGSRDAIWQLSKKGFKLPVGENPSNELMPLFHSPRLILVDAQGRIRGYYDGMSEQGLDNVQRDLQRVLRETPRAPASATAAQLVGFTEHAESTEQSRSAEKAGSDEHAEPVYTERPIPPKIINPPWLQTRKQEQLELVGESGVLHDFKFSDQWEASQIRFMHRVVDDAGKTYKPVHYDHGNGVAVADVDGDGHGDLYFCNQVGGNQLWRNRGDGTFEDITQRAGVGVADRISVTASFADVDNDGDPDLYVTSVRQGNLLFENDGTGRFKDISSDSGLDHQGHSSGAVFFDYDRDGLTDLFLANVGQYTTDTLRMAVNDVTTRDREPGEFHFYDGYKDAFGGHLKPERTEPSILFRNTGQNRFVDVSEQTGLIDASWTGDASPIDRNQDGWPDLYVLNMQGHDQYWENVEGKSFVNKSREVFPSTPWGSMGIKVFDYNNDGNMDIYITDMHSDMSKTVLPEQEKLKAQMRWAESFLARGGIPSIYGNALFENDGSGGFKEVSDWIGAENFWPWGLSVGDLNADGHEDVFIASSMNYPFRYGANSVLLNNRGEEFLDSEFVLGVEPRRDGRTTTPWFELDCSGADKDHDGCKGREGRVVVTAALGSRSSVIFDLDGDGDLDIVTSDFNSEPMVLVSNLAQTHDIRYLKVGLIGAQSNRDGLGATVKVTAGDQTWTKVHDGQSGYLSQSLTPLYFGLGQAATVDQIEVIWPSGQTQTHPGPIQANDLLELQEPTPS